MAQKEKTRVFDDAIKRAKNLYKDTVDMGESINVMNMKEKEFIEKFPIGTIISFIEGQSLVKSGARTIFRIDRYDQISNGDYFMYGIWCGFDFQTNNYKKEFSWTDLSKWHCIDCTDDVMGTALGTLLHKFNDVRYANNSEKNIFYKCLANLK